MPGEQFAELSRDDRKGQAVAGEGHGALDDIRAIVRMFEQARREIEELLGAASVTAQLRENQPLGGAVATNAGHATQDRVARDLSRDSARIQLPDDLVLCEKSQVAGIRQPLFDDSQQAVRKAQPIEQTPSAPAIAVEDRHRFEQGLGDLFDREYRREVISRRRIEFARADKNAAALFERPREIPMF